MTLFRTVDPHPPTVPNRKLGAFPKVDLLLISSIVLKFVFNLRCCEDEDDEVEEDGDEVKLEEDGDEFQEDGDEVDEGMLLQMWAGEQVPPPPGVTRRERPGRGRRLKSVAGAEDAPPRATSRGRPGRGRLKREGCIPVGLRRRPQPGMRERRT